MDYLTALAISKLTRTDPPRRNEARAKVRILTLSGAVCVGGVCLSVPEDAPVVQVSPHLRAREITAEVYEEDLPELMSLVEPNLSEATIAKIEDDLVADLDAWAEPILKGRTDKDQAMADAERSFPGSFPGYWRRAHPKLKRDLKPFISVQRLEESAPSDEKKSKKAA